ncbi:hypothetical protein ACF090_20320 [Streptomyces sp. NPDC014892]|uniref:hypothetical protein n=1 Tax=Streptomyces sp. NPDC014892 TaxID=3364930 RepID=UPI0036FEA300
MSATPSTSACAERSPVRALARRWPTVLALALTVPGLILSASAEPTPAESAATVDAYAEFLPLLPLLYVVVHQIGTPRVTWPVLAAGASFAFALQALDLVSPAGVMVGTALAVLLWGAARHAIRNTPRSAPRSTAGATPHSTPVFAVQAAGTVVFGALAVTGLILDADLGRYLIAAGWFCHGVWDLAHLRTRRLRGVVAPSFAEWCAVVDVVVAVELLFLA